ncbi:Metallo-dependent phosphatase-like protein [Zychaea mexicana]|uniref:Metallo-dependent phosphatase-like protein n=1 Tax=Zychaea mexicana TaxID=64656 RepID=UPI0022FDE84F|nr:Metallo-dependent phosphatase-like protein [Zychaea mexicana]KAI9498188.1 Metallo-dependent phosphatase-like protein [Zychaea mexicana]
MNLSRSTWACILLLVLSLLRAGQVYQSSIAELSRGLTTQDAPIVPETTAPDSRIPAYRFEEEENDRTVLDDKNSNIFYFVQVSDLHLSKYKAQGHTNHFLQFMHSVLPNIKPELVVVTGDLTDAKASDAVKTQQYPEEWEMYKAVVEQGAGGIPWYDMRGNHDAFNIESWQSEQNLYRTYGMSAKQIEVGQGVYSWHVDKPFGQYQFVVADASPKKGPARPLNFFGYLTSKTMDHLASAIMTPTRYNHTFVFSHYPTTTMVFGESSHGYRYKDLAQHMSVYFCGHLHRLVAGMGDVLKSYNARTDSLELELADMKDHGAFRIVAIDNDLISFVDAELPLSKIQNGIPALSEGNKVSWPEKVPIAPIIVITNPKDSRYVLGGKEPYYRTRRSTHIRFLVFSESEPSQLRVRITVDGLHHPFPAKFVGTSDTPLWVSSWEPNDFDDRNQHTLRIEVTSKTTDLTGESSVDYRMDDVRLSIGGGFGEWLIGHHVVTLVSRLSVISSLTYTIPI